MKSTRRCFLLAAGLVAALGGAMGCSDDSTADGGSDGSSGGGDATCASLCQEIEGECGADPECMTECTSDQEDADMCGASSEWQSMMNCCKGADFAPHCGESGFDPCQKGACESMRPACL